MNKSLSNFSPSITISINGKEESYENDPNKKNAQVLVESDEGCINLLMDNVIADFTDFRDSLNMKGHVNDSRKYSFEFGKTLLTNPYNGKLSYSTLSHIYFPHHHLLFRVQSDDAQDIRQVESHYLNRTIIFKHQSSFNSQCNPKEMFSEKLSQIYALIEDCYEEMIYDLSSGIIVLK